MVRSAGPQVDPWRAPHEMSEPTRPPPPPPLDTQQILAMRKQRLISRLTLGGVAVLTAGAFLILALADTSAVEEGSIENPANRPLFSWEKLADRLPPLAAAPPKIFESLDGKDPLFPEARQASQEDMIGMGAGTEEMSAEEREALAAKIKSFIGEGDKLLRSRRFQDAENAYMEAVKLQDDLKVPIGKKFFDQGRKYERQRAWSRAKLLYRMSLHFDYENASFHRALAKTSRALGDTKKAAEHERLAEKFEK